MKPVTHVLLLATGLMGCVSIAVAVQDNTAASGAVEEKGKQVESWFDALGIKERALKTRSVERFAYSDSSQVDANTDFIERAFKTRAVQRDHVQDNDVLNSAWAFCLPEDWGGQSDLVAIEEGLGSNQKNGDDFAFQTLLPEHLDLRC